MQGLKFYHTAAYLTNSKFRHFFFLFHLLFFSFPVSFPSALPPSRTLLRISPGRSTRSTAKPTGNEEVLCLGHRIIQPDWDILVWQASAGAQTKVNYGVVRAGALRKNIRAPEFTVLRSFSAPQLKQPAILQRARTCSILKKRERKWTLCKRAHDRR